MRIQEGFTLIELMVVIVILGILSAMAIPKMFGVSSKAKAAEAPGIVAGWETLQVAYAQETGQAGTELEIGFTNPNTTNSSKWFDYEAVGSGASATFTATPTLVFGNCDGTDMWESMYTAAGNLVERSDGDGCGEEYTPNFD